MRSYRIRRGATQPSIARWPLLLVFPCITAFVEAQERRHPHPPAPGKQLPGDYLPTRLNIYIGGGIFPPSYSVDLRGESLVYRARELDPQTHAVRERTKVITPSAGQWRRFWRAMDDVQLWSWQPQYANPLIADGTKWGLDITFVARRIASSGSNAYPGGSAGSSEASKPDTNPPGASRRFSAYRSAVEDLLGGEPFR